MNRQIPRSATFASVIAIAACAVLAVASLSERVGAKTPEVRIDPLSDLSFGRFMVFGSGTRTVSASGAVSDSSIVALEGGASPGPARFTISYDRGNQSRHTLNIELEVVMSAAPQVRQGGVDARLSAFETNLPGALRINPGQAIRISMPNCRTRICSRSFQVGGRLDVTRRFGGANLLIPIPLDATVISVERQRR